MWKLPKLVEVSIRFILYDPHSFCIYASFDLQHHRRFYVLDVIYVFLIAKILQPPNLVSLAMKFVTNDGGVHLFAWTFNIECIVI